MTFLPELSCHLRRRRGASDAGRAGRGDRESCVTESGWEAAELQGRGSGLRCEQSLSPGGSTATASHLQLGFRALEISPSAVSRYKHRG